MGFCRTIQRVFNPVIMAPIWNNPLGTPNDELLWVGSYNGGERLDGTQLRRRHYLESTSRATPEQREKAFNKYLIYRYLDLYR